MSGLASPAPRRSAAPESASRSRPEAAARAPARQLPAPRLASRGQEQVPSTRERIQASVGAAESPGPRVRGRDGIRALGPVPQGPLEEVAAAPALAVMPPAAETLTTRDRIVNRALAAPEAAPAATEPAIAPAEAVVVDIAELQDRRGQRQPDTETAPPGPGAPLAPVIVLAPRPKLARPPPEPAAEDAATGPARGDVEATGAPARAPPAEEPAVIAVSTRPGLGTGAEAGGAPARAGPETIPEPGAVPAGAGPETDLTLAAPSAEPSAGDAMPGAPPGVAGPQLAPAAPAAPQPEATGVAAAAPPAAPPGFVRNPDDEPGFQAMKQHVGRAAMRTKDHQPGKEGAETAQGASAPDPQKDIDSQAADEHVQAMGRQEPGPFDAAAFKRDVKARVESMAPPATLEEADDFEQSGRAGQAATAIQGIVSAGRAESERDIQGATAAEPVSEGKEPKPVSEMVNDKPGPPLPDVGAAAALPGRRPPEDIDLSAGPLEIEARMAGGNITEEQLADANEPQFAAALDARQDVHEHATADPGEYRTHEGLVLAQGRVEAEQVAARQLEGMHAARTGTLDIVLAAKNETKAADEQLRDDIHQAILDIHQRTRADVETLLGTLDSAVDTIFTEGEQDARKKFEDYVAEEMRKYKDDRYSGVLGDSWAKDKIFDLPDDVNRFYEQGRADYLEAMDRVIEAIAIVVGLLLGAAQLRIQAGREEVHTFVAGLDVSVRSLGEDTAADLDNDFDQLSADADSKRDELVDTIARKYIESRDDLDTRIKELQEANKGLVSRAIDAVVSVIKTVWELTKLLLRVLLKAAAAIGDIVAHPIRFLENLVGAVKDGLQRFLERFPAHLQESLVDLLFGELGRSGIIVPAQLDFAGIVDLVLQVLGLTYASIRERVVMRLGEPAVAQMEQKVDVFTTLVREGVGGLWTWIQEKLTDLEDLVIGKIKEYIEERVVKAGIGYIVALLNPAAAFIKACQGIYQIVMFIVERAKQIADFVDAILDSIGAIAQGNVGAVVEKIDGALGGALTLAIGFLARLAGLGALSDKMRSIIAVVRRPITRVVDGIVFGAAEVYRRTLGPALAVAKAKVQSGKELLKGKTESERERVKRGPELAEAAPPDKVADGPEAPAAGPLPDAAAAGPLVIHEPFRIEGHDHEIYTGEDGKQLMLSSPQPTPITAVPDPTGALARLHTQYVAARSTYDSALARLAANPHSRPGVGTARKQINTIIGRIVARIGRLRPDDSPGASAPGIGDKGRHGEKRTSVRFGPPLWHLESEHVIPFAVGKQLWDAAGELIPRRGRAADRRQTTIMIYEGAARLKTSRHDEALWTAFREQYNANLRPTVRSLQTVLALAETRGGVDRLARNRVEELLDRFRSGLLKAGASAVEATQEAVRDEHASADGGGPTHGARRAEPSPLPGNDPIQTAAAEQFIDVYELVRANVERGLGR